MARRYKLKREEIVSLYKKENVTGKDLAELLSIHPSDFSNKLNGNTTCCMDEVLTLATYFNVPYTKIACYYTPVTAIQRTEAEAYMKGRFFNKDLFNQLVKNEGLTKQAFGDLLGISLSSMSRWCIHASNPMPDMAVMLCKYFEKPLSSFFIDGNLLKNRRELDSKEVPDKEEVYCMDNSTYQGDQDKIVADYDEDTTELSLQAFEEGNIIENLKVINDNLILLARYVEKKVMETSSVCSDLYSSIRSLDQKIDSLKDATKNDSNGMPKAIVKTNVVLPPTLTDSSVISLCKEDCKNDSLETYRTKIQKLLFYIAKKQNLVYNQVAHNFYKEFEKVYGMSLNMMRKGYTKDTSTIEIIYNDKATREIFYNVIATEASHYAGDVLSVAKMYFP